MDQDPYERDLALRVFQWVLGARRPLHIKELIHATALEDGQRIIDPDDLPSDDLDILSICRNLIRADKLTNNVEFIHSSVTDFLSTLRDSHVVVNPFDHIHYHLSTTCLRYLMLECFQRPAGEQDDENQTRRNEKYMPNLWGSLVINEEDEPDRFFHFDNGISKCGVTQLSTFSRAYPFFRYAALFWSIHVSLAVQEEIPTASLAQHITQFYNSTALETWILASGALEARVMTLAYKLEGVCGALHNGYIGTDISERREKFDDLERFRGKRGTTKIWKPGFFTQHFSTIVNAQETVKALGGMEGMCHILINLTVRSH
jgi:hypothetical protein